MNVVMTVGPKGQVVIPKPFRDEFGLYPGAEVVFSKDNRKLNIERKSEQMEKIRAEIEQLVKLHRVKKYKRLNIDKLWEEELLEDMKRWKTP